MSEITSLLINLSWSENNNSPNALIGDFEIEFFNSEGGDLHRASLNFSTSEKLVSFLIENKIKYSRERISNDYYHVYMKFPARIFLTPNHHIELRA